MQTLRGRAALLPCRLTPADAPAIDHGDGRSPGLRVGASRRLPGYPVAQMTLGSPLTVAGTATALALGRTVFPFDPAMGNHQPLG